MRQYDAPRRNKQQVRNVRRKCNKTIKHTLKYYEKKLTAALLKNAPYSLLTLTERAYGNDLINHEVKSQLESLDPSVPNSLMCRYLLLHVQKEIYSQSKMMHWLELLSTFEVPSNLLSLVRQHCDGLVGMSKEGGDGERGIFREFEVPALTEALAGHSNKWPVIAISLGLPDNKIKNIDSKNVGKPVEVALNEALLSWVRDEFVHAKPPTLRNLQKALRSNTVGLGALANKVELVNSQRIKHSVSDISKEFGIVDHTKHVVVTEGNHALLEVQISGNHEATYLWAHSNVNLAWSYSFDSSFGCDSIICILAGISSEGYFKCKVTCTNKKPLYTEPILVTVHTPIDQYKSFLIDRYTRSPEIPKEWPPESTNSFINLALIKQEDIHKAGKYGRCTIRGDMDDIFKDKESIIYDKALGNLSSGACLLIEGRPGSGKTTLVHKFSQDWARNEITITHVRLLFLIHLRGFCSDPNIGLCDLIGCYFSGSDVEVIEKYANKHQGLGLCFVLDGLDEYIPQKKNTYIYELIRKHVLPKSVVIVASRPAAAANIRKEATRQIEVLGFLRDEIYDYIKNYPFASPSKSHSGLIRYLDEHPNVLHMCYLPIHTCMICFLYDNLDSSLPQTETSIYAEFTKFTMLRMLYRDDSNTDMCIESLNDLPEPQNQLYTSICKLAFEMTKTSKQVMRQTEVKHFFHLQPTDKDCMGLITVDKMAMMCGFQNLYTFLHLTFQEFLSAFYIISLDEENQLELIEQFKRSTQMKQVWKFYCGLVPFHGINSTVIRLIDQSRHGTPFKVQCSFESQQPCTCDSVVYNNSLMFHNHFFTSSDFTAMAYVISNAKHQCVNKVEFDKCTISMEGIEILAQKAYSKLSLITALYYHGYDCVTEQLSVVNKLIHSLPYLEILDISKTNLGPAEVDALTGSLLSPNLLIVKVGSQGNKLYSSPGLPLLLAKRFSSGCSKLVNVCFSGGNYAYWSFPFPFYFYCNVPHINMCFKLRPLELHVLLDDLIYSHNCTVLNLTGCGIDDNTASILAYRLMSTNLKILDLSCNRIGDSGATHLTKMVNSCKKLGKLNLTFNRISNESATALASIGMCNVYFDTLIFSGCAIGDSGVESLLGVIDSIVLTSKTVQCYSDVHVLDISFNNISCHGAKAISSCLTNLEELNISSNNIEAEGAKDIASCLSHDRVYKLNISRNNISSSGAKAIANALKHLAEPFYLTKLDISYNNIGYEGCKAISAALNHCNCLEELNISGNDIGEDGACVLASSVCNFAQCLHMLDVSSNNIGSNGVNAIANALEHCTHLEELSVHNTIGDSSVCKFALCLHKLDISSNNIGSNGVNAIANALEHCTHLEELSVSDNIIGDDGACIIASSLGHYAQSLHKLDISSNYIGSKGVNAIANALKQCTHLKELIVSDNIIGDDGASIITSTFGHYAQCLHKLSMNNNHIGSKGCEAIAEALRHCVNLKQLDLSYNYLDEGDTENLIEVLSLFNVHQLAVCRESYRWESCNAYTNYLYFKF